MAGAVRRRCRPLSEPKKNRRPAQKVKYLRVDQKEPVEHRRLRARKVENRAGQKASRQRKPVFRVNKLRVKFPVKVFHPVVELNEFRPSTSS